MRRLEPEWSERCVEQLDVVRVDPQVVVRRQHGNAERNQRAPPDEQDAGAAVRDGVEQLLLVELCAAHAT